MEPTPKFEDQDLGVLQNIEFAIVSVFRDHPELTDYQVDNALAALIRVYQARSRAHSAPHISLRPLEQDVFEAVKFMCDWRLGELQSQGEEAPEPGALGWRPNTPDEIVACLKRIRKSISLWTKQGGRQGYLSYVNFFLAPYVSGSPDSEKTI